MQVFFIILYTCAIFSIKRTQSSVIPPSPFYPLKAEDLLDGDVKEIEYWDKFNRAKRSGSGLPIGSSSGSGEIVGELKSAVVSGLQKKLGQIAHGSAGAVGGASSGFLKASGSLSSGSSGGSGGSGKHVITYAEPGTYQKPFDAWELKRSVLNTLLQAIKAIKGGVLAIQGQLIKGSGYLVSGGGKLIAAGGDKVTDLGKNIIGKAVLVPPSKGGHKFLSGSNSYTAPSSEHIDDYEVVPPSSGSSGPGYLPDSHYGPPFEEKPHHTSPGGLLILRKITPNKEVYTKKEISHPSSSGHGGSSAPGVGNILGKFFSASASLDPSQPAPYGSGTGTGTYHDDYGNNYSIERHQTETDQYRHSNNKAAISTNIEPPTPVSPSPPQYQETLDNAKVNSESANLIVEDHSNEYGGSSSSGGGGLIDLGSYDPLKAIESKRNETRVRLTKGEVLERLKKSPTMATSQIFLPTNPTDNLKKPQSSSSINNSIYTDQEHSPSVASLANFLPKEDTYTSEHKRIVLVSRKRKRAPNLQESAHLLSRPNFNIVKSLSYEITPEGLKQLN